MSKNTTGLIVLAVGAAALIGYKYAPDELKDKLNAGMGGGVNFNLADLLGGVNIEGGGLPEWQIPDLPEFSLPEIPEATMPDWWKDFWNSPPPVPEVPTPAIPAIPNPFSPEGGIGETGISMPEPETVQSLLSHSFGIGMRQYAGAAITGQHIIRPLPFAAKVEKLALGKVIPKVMPKLAPRLFAKTGARVGLRAVPILGWALTGVDLGADLLRVFGVDVTEWLGFSGIVSTITGENPIEKWANSGESESGLEAIENNAGVGLGLTTGENIAIEHFYMKETPPAALSSPEPVLKEGIYAGVSRGDIEGW